MAHSAVTRAAPAADAPEDSIVIVGTGFGGLGMAIRLKLAGIDDFVLLEQADEVGGTWRDNHYPGAACDVQSHLYSFSFELNPHWTRQFAMQPEILAYLIACTDKYGIRPHIRFGKTVKAARFDEGTSTWAVETTSGETFRGRVLVSACGGLSRPSYPDIAGLKSFAGTMFHTARWDESNPIDGKTVGVIGTGASAIQIVPAITPRVGHLTLFQRSAPWILPKPDFAISAVARALYARLPALQQATRKAIYLQREVLATAFVYETRLLKVAEFMSRRYLAKSVADPVLRAKLTPDYALGCKRVLPTNDYYAALTRPNVEVVTDGIDRIVPSGILTRDGKEHRLDALVLATGFQAAEQLAPFDIYGRGGVRLDAAWANGAEAYLGTTVSGFPNAFLLSGPNTGLGHSSMVFMIESQIQYAFSGIQAMRERRLRSVDVRPDVTARFNAELQDRLSKTIWASGCKSWYRTPSGKNTTLWPGYTFEFRSRTRHFDVADYTLEWPNAAMRAAAE